MDVIAGSGLLRRSRPLFQTQLYRPHPWGRTSSMTIMDDTNKSPNITTSYS